MIVCPIPSCQKLLIAAIAAIVAVKVVKNNRKAQESCLTEKEEMV